MALADRVGEGDIVCSGEGVVPTPRAPPTMLVPGVTCWRIGQAPRLALIVDAADYYLAVREAMNSARRSIYTLNWSFDPETSFAPGSDPENDRDARFGPFMRSLADRKPELDIRILCWNAALPCAALRLFFFRRARRCFAGSTVQFRLDGSVPLGASHHQKVIVVDDEIAFCGGCDIGPDRWDTSLHLHVDTRRRKTPSKPAAYPPRHELMALVDGDPARAFGELFRTRWAGASGRVIDQPASKIAPTSPAEDPWPPTAAVAARQVTVGIARSLPRRGRSAGVREIEAFHLAAIRSAKTLIYLENQYFTSAEIANALAQRLIEDNGPEVVLVTTLHSPSWFDRLTMDNTRLYFMQQLTAADRDKRFHAYSPRTPEGAYIVVHAKATLIDDRLLRIGSANFNNRSMGFDTECDLIVEAEADAEDGGASTMIAAFRTRLLAHWLGCSEAEILEHMVGHAPIARLIAALDPGQRRLASLEPSPLGPASNVIAKLHIGDPIDSTGAWKPWLRKRNMNRLEIKAYDVIDEVGP